MTTLGSGVDGSVRRLGYSFNTQGLPFQQTSYSNTTGTTIVNQVEDVYNGLGQLITQYQDHSGSVSHSTSPKVQYTYNEMGGGANNSRITAMTYPNGRVLNYNYNSGIDTTISRLSNEADAAGSGAGTDEAYTYHGLGTVVQKTDGNGIDLSYIQQAGDTSYINDGGDQYTGLDRFGRVIDQYWSPTSSPTSPTDRFQFAYDENGNVLYKNNLLSSANSELYHANSTTSGDNQTGYDPLSRLTSFSRGTLSMSGHNGSSGLGSLDTVGTVVHGQSWTLDDEGNWTSFTSDATTQTRTNNTDNQITSISGATTPTYNNNGDTIKDERGYTLTYDAWNHAMVVKNASSTTIAGYSYDANGWRIADSTGGQDRYFNAAGQELEDRNGSGTVTNQYVWSADGNIQHLVLRDDNSSSGSLGATSSGLGRRLYVQQDANGDVTALTNTSGAVQERFIYDPYGSQTVLTPSWGTTTDSYNWVYGFQGGHLETATGIYRFGARDYTTTLGRWMEEDPAGYVDGTNLYESFDSDPSGLADPSGTTASDWQWIGDAGDWSGHRQVFRSTRDGASLEALSATYGESTKRCWECLWPVITSAKSAQFYKKKEAACGDEYSLQNLQTTDGPTLDVSFVVPGDDQKHMSTFTGATASVDNAVTLAHMIRDAAGQGATPLKNLIIGSHGNGGSKGIFSGGWGMFSYFGVTYLRAAADPRLPDLELAKQHIGPPICWFVNNAAYVQFLGCNTSAAAQEFASTFVRGAGSKVYGTTANFWTDGTLGGFVKNEGDPRIGGVSYTQLYQSMTNWKEYPGSAGR